MKTNAQLLALTTGECHLVHCALLAFAFHNPEFAVAAKALSPKFRQKKSRKKSLP